MFTVIGSLAAIVAVALFSSLFTITCVEGSDVVIAPSVTVKLSAASDSMSSVAVMVMVWVDPLALFAAKVTVPDVTDRSDPSAASVPRGALHATCTWAATASDSVTVKTALPPSATFDVGPVMRRSVESMSSGSSFVVPLRSLRVISAEVTVRPTSVVVVPGMMMVSLPSTTLSSIGVMVSVPLPLAVFAGMVMLARAVVTV